jgi:protein SCO1/2
MASRLRLTMIAGVVALIFMLLARSGVAASAADEPALKVDRAWARATPGSATTSAAYLRIESPVDDRLIAITTPVARKAELHTHVEEDGVLQMHQIEDGLPLPANQVLQLGPGGRLHVMLIDLNAPLKAGDRFPLTLHLAKAGAYQAMVTVERLGAMGLSEPEPAKATASEIGGPFTLVDQDGHTVTDTQFRGKWLLVYFGYTHCPDVCPTALTYMAQALVDLDAAKRSRVQAIFITVDPQRDTPAVMKDYVGAFDGASILGLSGTPQQVLVAETSYRVRAKRHDREDGDYTMSHTSTIHIIGPDGQFVGPAPPERIGEQLAELVP